MVRRAAARPGKSPLVVPPDCPLGGPFAESPRWETMGLPFVGEKSAPLEVGIDSGRPPDLRTITSSIGCSTSSGSGPSQSHLPAPPFTRLSETEVPVATMQRLARHALFDVTSRLEENPWRARIRTCLACAKNPSPRPNSHPFTPWFRYRICSWLQILRQEATHLWFRIPHGHLLCSFMVAAFGTWLLLAAIQTPWPRDLYYSYASTCAHVCADVYTYTLLYLTYKVDVCPCNPFAKRRGAICTCRPLYSQTHHTLTPLRLFEHTNHTPAYPRRRRRCGTWSPSATSRTALACTEHLPQQISRPVLRRQWGQLTGQKLSFQWCLIICTVLISDGDLLRVSLWKGCSLTLQP